MTIESAFLTGSVTHTFRTGGSGIAIRTFRTGGSAILATELVGLVMGMLINTCANCTRTNPKSKNGRIVEKMTENSSTNIQIQ